MSTTDFSSHFGINNIPFGIASSSSHSNPQCVTRYESTVIFVSEIPGLESTGLGQDVFAKSTLNAFAGSGREAHRAVREAIQSAIKHDKIPASAKKDIKDVKLHLPVQVGDFTDFSCSPHHNRNAGQALLGMSRGLPPGYLHHPLGYAGRCSSINVSGTSIRRPRGQYFEHGNEGLKGGRTTVTYGPSRWMDYELEIGVVVGQTVKQGDYVTADKAGENIFGFVLLNDWSGESRSYFSEYLSCSHC